MKANARTLDLSKEYIFSHQDHGTYILNIKHSNSQIVLV